MASTVSELKLADNIPLSVSKYCSLSNTLPRSHGLQSELQALRNPSALRVSVEIGRVNGSLDLVEDDQFVCHVQTLRLR